MNETAFEKVAREFTGRDMEWHKRAGTWGVDKDSLAYACWDAAIAAALTKCEIVQDSSPYFEMLTPNEVAEKCKAEIQKLRS